MRLPKLRSTVCSRLNAENTAEFQCWIVDWNPAAQKHQFSQKLSEKIKDNLARVETSNDIETLIQLCIQNSQRRNERRKDRLGMSESKHFSVSQQRTLKIFLPSNTFEPIRTAD